MVVTSCSSSPARRIFKAHEATVAVRSSSIVFSFVVKIVSLGFLTTFGDACVIGHTAHCAARHYIKCQIASRIACYSRHQIIVRPVSLSRGVKHPIVSEQVLDTDKLTLIGITFVCFVVQPRGGEVDCFFFLKPIIAITIAIANTSHQFFGYDLGIPHDEDIAHGKRRLLKVTLKMRVCVLISEIRVTRHIASQREVATITVVVGQFI